MNDLIKVAGVAALKAAGMVAVASISYWVGNQFANEKERKEGFDEGRKAGESTADQKYQKKINELLQRLTKYHNFEDSIVAMWSLGLALANKDRHFWNKHLENLEIITGLSSNKLPQNVQDVIASLKQKPPVWEDALITAKKAKLPKSDIDDIVDIIAFIHGYANSEITSIWELSSKEYRIEEGV